MEKHFGCILAIFNVILISGVIPYLPYSQHCFMRKRGCITAKLLASMLTKAGLNHLVTMDLFHKEIQGFYNFTVDNLRGSLYLVEHIKHNVSGSVYLFSSNDFIYCYFVTFLPSPFPLFIPF